MDEEYEDLKKKLSDIIAGNEEAEKELGLNPIKVDFQGAKITETELQLVKQQYSEIAMAAKALNFPILEQCARSCLNYVNVIYSSIAKKALKPEVIAPQDYCQTVVAILKEIESGISLSSQRSDKSAPGTERDVECDGEA